jgi:hypothetical protein
MRVEVVEVVENEDGTLTVTVNMDQKCMIQFAKMGLVDAIINTAEDILDGGYDCETFPHAEDAP